MRVTACSWFLILLALAVCSTAAHAEEEQTLIVGSKAFPESNIVAEIVTQLAASEGLAVKHRAGVGPTQVVYKALLAGEIDLYP